MEQHVEEPLIESATFVEGKVLVLVLVGLQGSGKTTLTARLKYTSRHLSQGTSENIIYNVVGINQDAIRRDFPWVTRTQSRTINGSREECVKVFRREFETQGNLGNGLVIVIDRTNLTIEQRRTWVEEVRAQRQRGIDVSVFCVFLDIPAKVCSERAAQRKDHEGGVHGQKAYPIVHRSNSMLQRPDPATEGFDEVLTITTDEQSDIFVDIIHDLMSKGSLHPSILQSFRTTNVEKICLHENRPKKIAKGCTNAFDVLMKAAKEEALVKNNEANKAFHSTGSNRWQDALLWYAKTPFDKNSTLVLYSDDQCVIIRDKYPKAKIHLLCIARDLSLREPLDIKPRHISILKHMKKVSIDFIDDFVDGLCDEDVKKHRIQMGFHAVPSLKQLHLHIISTDFDSPCLKTRKHWISFTNKDFFLEIDEIITKPPEYNIKEKSLLLRHAPLTCPRCLKSDFKSVSVVLDHYHQNNCS